MRDTSTSATRMLSRQMWRLTNETEEAHDAAEYFHDENLHEQVRVGRIRKRGRGAGDANTDTAQEVARTDGETSPEERVALRRKISSGDSH